MTPEGVFSVVAGTPGVSGSADGATTVATFGFLGNIWVNSDGSLIYVADQTNSVIRKIELIV